MCVKLLYYMGPPEVLSLNMLKGMQHQPSCNINPYAQMHQLQRLTCMSDQQHRQLSCCASFNIVTLKPIAICCRA